MPILSVSGEYIARKKQTQPKKKYKGKKVQAMKHNRGVSEQQAQYIIEMQEAKKSKAILRDEI